MNLKVIGIGEVLWDLLEDGRQMGGAPANFAYHAQALGAQSGVITRLGRDDLGRDLQRKFKELLLPLELVQTDVAMPTGVVSIELADEGIPKYKIQENVAWDNLMPTDEALNAARDADAICFGTLAQRSKPSRETIQKILSQASASSLRIFDVNLRQNFFTKEIIQSSLELANVLKLNDAELPVLTELFNLTGDVRNQLCAIAERFDLSVIALTRGPLGSLLYQRGRWSECQTRTVRVKDTVGAGDAFTAALVMGLLQNMDLDQINKGANEVARHVCACAGAMPSLSDDLRVLFNATQIGNIPLPLLRKTTTLSGFADRFEKNPR